MPDRRRPRQDSADGAPMIAPSSVRRNGSAHGLFASSFVPRALVWIVLSLALATLLRGLSGRESRLDRQGPTARRFSTRQAHGRRTAGVRRAFC